MDLIYSDRDWVDEFNKQLDAERLEAFRTDPPHFLTISAKGKH